MDQFLGEILSGQRRIALLVLMSVAGCLVAAVFLRLAARWVADIALPYKKALGTCLLALTMAAPVLIGAEAIMGRVGAGRYTEGVLLGIGFVVLSAVVGARLKREFGTAVLIVLLMSLLAGAVGVLLTGAVVVVFDVLGVSREHLPS